jgi:uncharacterized protein (TIGR04255 family)
MNHDLIVRNGNPLVDPPPSDVKLERAPLSLVVTQFRFAPITKMEDQAYIASFQEQVRGEYPLLVPERMTLSMTLGAPSASTSVNTRTIWRMNSLDDRWRLILCQDFVALETTAYQSRADFLERWGRILSAFSSSFRDVTGLRFGLRYVNRISDPGLLSRIPELIRKEALGISALLPPAGVALSEAVYAVPEGSMLARWGFLPPGTTHDMGIQPAPMASWILDYDLFVDSNQSGRPIAPEEIAQKAHEFCLRGYSFFRWMTTEDFLIAHGGK